jgi:predicted phage-related endonuclease
MISLNHQERATKNHHNHKGEKTMKNATATTTTIKAIDIKSVIKEIKEYQAMKDALDKELDELKDEAIEYLTEQDIDEILTEEGKVTYREVISKRFDSTQFKKDFADIYSEYQKQTSSMRFTCN